MLTAPEVTIWTSPERATLAENLLDVMGTRVRPLGVGGPRSAEVDALAKRWDCPAGNDLRKLLIDRPAAYLLVTSLRDASIADLKAAALAGTRVLCLEPWAIERAELEAAETPGQPDALRFAPAFARAPGSLAAADPEEQLGQPRLVRFVSHGRPGEGSLVARLIDAWQSILQYADLPETVDATLRRNNPSGPVPQDPRQLSGWLAAHARLPDGGGVLLEVTDHATTTRRDLSVLGPDAQLHVTDGRYTLAGPGGKVIDAGGDGDDHPPFIDLIAHQWQQWLERPGPPAAPQRRLRAMACLHACLLSARTGSPESPGRLLQIGRP